MFQLKKNWSSLQLCNGPKMLIIVNALWKTSTWNCSNSWNAKISFLLRKYEAGIKKNDRFALDEMTVLQ